MAKLYFKYGAMGSSKSAQVLITKFNYEERGMKVLLLKPSIDTRDGADLIRSRIGLEAVAQIIAPDSNMFDILDSNENIDVVIVDECQFLSEDHVDQLRAIVDDKNIPVMCFGLRTDFLTKLFPGSRRLFEIADSITEIKTICDCGAKATCNARIDENGRMITHGEQVFLGGNDSYIALCHRCYMQKKIKSEQGE